MDTEYGDMSLKMPENSNNKIESILSLERERAKLTSDYNMSIKDKISNRISINNNLKRYLQKVQRGLNEDERLQLWRSLPNYTKYCKYYRSRIHNFYPKRSPCYREVKNDLKRTHLHS